MPQMRRGYHYSLDHFIHHRVVATISVLSLLTHSDRDSILLLIVWLLGYYVLCVQSYSDCLYRYEMTYPDLSILVMTCSCLT